MALEYKYFQLSRYEMLISKESGKKTLNKCSKEMMLLLIAAYKKQMNDLFKDLDQIHGLLKPLKKQLSYNDKETSLIERLDIFKKDVLMKEEKKMIRDRTAFREGKAYKWHSIQNRQRTYGNASRRES